MRQVFLLSLMILGAYDVKSVSGTVSRNPAEIIREQLASIDSVSATLAATALKSDGSRGSVDSMAQSILDNNRVIQGITLFDKSGAVINSYDRHKKTVTVQNVASKEWFTVPGTVHVPFFGGVVKANSRNCLLKSFPLALNTINNNSSGVLVVLVDIAQVLEQFEHQFGQPFTVKYKSVQLSGTSAGNAELPFHAIIPGYDNLEISYGAESGTTPTDAIRTGHSSDANAFSPAQSPLVYTFIALFLGLILFACGRYYLKKNISLKLLEMEYEKISKEQQKQIHDRALSQVYCEVKRQIETHEREKIEDEIRHKIEHDIREKVLVKSDGDGLIIPSSVTA